MVQRPSNLDSAFSLALVEEEAIEARRIDDRSSEPSFNRKVPRTTLPLPVPPKIDKYSNRASRGDNKYVTTPTAGSAEEKIAALRAYRHARNLRAMWRKVEAWTLLLCHCPTACIAGSLGLIPG